MLDNATELFVRTVLDAMPFGRVFSLPDLGISGYGSVMTDAQCRGMGKRFDDSVRKHRLDGVDYRTETVPGSRKPQQYRKVAIPAGVLLEEADIPATLRHLADLLDGNPRLGDAA
jgi:hypothetical protein